MSFFNWTYRGSSVTEATELSSDESSISYSSTCSDAAESNKDKGVHSYQNRQKSDVVANPGKKMTGNGIKTVAVDGHPELQRTNSMMQTFAGVAGNVLEWYDFAVFGYFSDIIGDVFFPPQKGHAAIVESFAVFGGAFIMRPIGGILMGYIGDTYGRKVALEISIFLMAIPTFAMGCLPSYAQVGWPSIALLTLVRLLQGVSVGGQMMSSLVFTVEGSPKSQWGLYGSYVMASANFGTLLGGFVGFVMRALLSYESLRAWGWRVPFLAGVLVSFVGVYLRLYCEDHSHCANNSSSTPSNPIKLALSQDNRRSLISSCLVPMIWSSGFYLSFVWMAIFMQDLLQPALPGAFAINSASLLSSVVIFFPVAGHLSDVYGRVRIMTIGGFGMLFYSPIAINLIGLSQPILAYASQTLLGIVLSLWGSPMLAWLVESFEPEARLTSVSIGFNIAQALGAGLGPSLATVMVDKWGPTSPGYLYSFFAICGLIGLWIAPKNTQNREHAPICDVTDQPNSYQAV
jgi:MHS family proline/betaine transporter-like MFS transporter